MKKTIFVCVLMSLLMIVWFYSYITLMESNLELEVEKHQIPQNQLTPIQPVISENTKYSLAHMMFHQCRRQMESDQNKLHLFNTTTQQHECHIKFKYCDNSTPFLFSFGGSGNTVTRVIIAYITNIYTGSIYSDTQHETLLRFGQFMGEGQCGNSPNKNDVIIIKAHPEHMNKTKLKALMDGNCTIYDCICEHEVSEKHISNEILFRNNPYFVANEPILYGIFIVRDPWKAIWALYQFTFGKGCRRYDDRSVHTQHIYKTSTTECKINVHKLWNSFHFAESLLHGEVSWKRYLKTFELMELMDEYKQEYIVIKFENLVNLKQPLIAIQEMDKITQYLYQKEYYDTHKEILLQKMECLTMRLMSSDWRRFRKIHRSKPKISRHQMTIQQAYNDVNDSVICTIWSNIEAYATQYEYNVWNNTKCAPS